MKYLGYIITVPVLIWHGFVLSILWNWFLVGLGLPSITTFHGVGLIFTMEVLMPHYLPEEDLDAMENGGTKTTRRVLVSAIQSAVALIAGTIVHLFM